MLYKILCSSYLFSLSQTWTVLFKHARFYVQNWQSYSAFNYGTLWSYSKCSKCLPL